MRDRLGELEAVAPGLRVVVVTFAPVERLAGWRERLGLPFDLAADPERRAYRDWGLLVGSRWAVWHPWVLVRYARLVLSGMALQKAAADDDLAQLGGDFLLDAAGRIVFVHRSERPDDRPGVGELLRSVGGS